MIQQILEPDLKDLGGFQARRSLPHPNRMMIGPFIFFDHLGPATFPPGQGIDVRPHPHINLATVTYLFAGSLLHRDSLGTVQTIYPGAVNWMTAGRGIVHSERSPEDTRDQSSTLHAIQTWVALPTDQEETDPTFHHYPATDLPHWDIDGSIVTLIAGQLWNQTSPVKALSPILYLDVQLAAGGQIEIPPESSERAVYSVTAHLQVGQDPLTQHRLAVLPSGESVRISAREAARCVVIGGEPVGPRLKWWNFVSSRAERIEQAKQEWREHQFPSVPHETEFIPLPDDAS